MVHDPDREAYLLVLIACGDQPTTKYRYLDPAHLFFSPRFASAPAVNLFHFCERGRGAVQPFPGNRERSMIFGGGLMEPREFVEVRVTSLSRKGQSAPDSVGRQHRP